MSDEFSIPTDGGRPVCGICGEMPASDWLGDHLAEMHRMTVDQYKVEHPGQPTSTLRLHQKLLNLRSQETPHRANPAGLETTIGGLTFPVRVDVPAMACLSRPTGYITPQHGTLADDIKRVMRHLRKRRSCYVWGGPGTGKDAVFANWSWATRTPGLLFSVTPGTDIQSWKYTRSFDHRGTSWEEGVLLKSLRDGFVTESGTRIPYIIVLSDIDRATRNQMEELRLVLDSIEGRIQGPVGDMHRVLPGTILVATGNTAGGGDNSGRMVSANVMDASIKDRWERNVRFHNIAPEDEQRILIGKFPTLASKYPQVIAQITDASGKVREAIEKQEVFCEWSHRAVHAWAQSMEDILEVDKKVTTPKELIRLSLWDILDGLPNDDTVLQVRHIIDSSLPDGAVI